MKIIKKYTLIWKLRQANIELRQENVTAVNANFELSQGVVTKSKYDSVASSLERYKDSSGRDNEQIHWMREEQLEHYELKEKHTNLLASIKVLGVKIEIK